jgi:hypothetical protein
VKPPGHQSGEAKRDSDNRAEQDPKICARVIADAPHVRFDVTYIALNVLNGDFQLCYARFHPVKSSTHRRPWNDIHSRQ